MASMAFQVTAILPQASAGTPTGPGQLYAFGDNNSGQLGQSTIGNPNPTPALVSLSGAAVQVVEVAAGEAFSLVLTSTGQLYSFGTNYSGQLGSTTNNGTQSPNPTPTLVNLPGAVGPVTRVAAGSDFSLALTSTGQLFAFGDNDHGQLGNATNTFTSVANPVPTLVSFPGATGPVTAVSAGRGFSLALTSTGQLYGFGDNALGQLGSTINNETFSINPTPALVQMPAGSGVVTQMSAGDAFSLVLTSSGHLYGLGSNEFGQLGNTTNVGGYNAPPNPVPSLVNLPGEIGPVAQLAAGYYHSLVLTSTGQLYAFGADFDGQIGNASDKCGCSDPYPSVVKLAASAGPFASVAAGQYQSLAITATGQLYAFGGNDSGQSGQPPTPGTANIIAKPTLVAFPAGTTLDRASAGGNDSFVVVADLGLASRSTNTGQLEQPYSTQLTGTGGMPPYRWSAAGLRAGLAISPSSGAITGDPTGAGDYLVTVTVTDNYGIMGTAQVTIDINAPPSFPRLLALSISPHTWLATGRFVSGHCQPPTGANAGHRACRRPMALHVGFDLSKASQVVFKVTEWVGGRLVSGQCVVQDGANRQYPSCQGDASLPGTMTRPGAAGTNAFTWNGVIGGHGLGPGDYQLMATPTRAGLTGVTQLLHFQIAR